MRQLATKGTASELPQASRRLCLNLQCSGRKIIEILKKNPKKAPEKYEEEDLGHMRKVVSVRLCNPVHIVLRVWFVDSYKVLQASSCTGGEGETRHE